MPISCQRIGQQCGFGNQAIWANGQRDTTSNSIALNGVSADNLFNAALISSSVVELFAFHAEHRPEPARQAAMSRPILRSYDSVGSGDCDACRRKRCEEVQRERRDALISPAASRPELCTSKSSRGRAPMRFHGQGYEYFQNNDSSMRRTSSAMPDTAIAPQDHKVSPLRITTRYGVTLGASHQEAIMAVFLRVLSGIHG